MGGEHGDGRSRSMIEAGRAPRLGGVLHLAEHDAARLEDGHTDEERENE
jgi:hypothetical protein